MGMEVGGGFRMGNTCNPLLIHVNVWQKPLQYCKVISLQLIKINGKKTFCLKNQFKTYTVVNNPLCTITHEPMLTLSAHFSYDNYCIINNDHGLCPSLSACRLVKSEGFARRGSLT